jgi:hypothetical protein
VSKSGGYCYLIEEVLGLLNRIDVVEENVRMLDRGMSSRGNEGVGVDVWYIVEYQETGGDGDDVVDRGHSE